MAKKIWDRKALCKLYGDQKERLMERGLPPRITWRLFNQFDKTIETALRMKFSPTEIPFLPVIPYHILGLDYQMAMVWRAGKIGASEINLPPPDEDEKISPNSSYYIFGVDDGGLVNKDNRLEAEKELTRLKRIGLTVEEICSLALHTDVLSRHRVCAVQTLDEAASHFEQEQTPVIWLKLHSRLQMRATLESIGLFVEASRGGVASKRIAPAKNYVK